MPAKKKKIHEHVKDQVVNWDEKMKKYRFYKEIVKDLLLMVPLFGSVGGTVLNWSYKAFMRYQETAVAVKESASRVARRSSEVLNSPPPPMADSMASAPSVEAYTMGDMIIFVFVFWLVCVLGWRLWKKMQDKFHKVKQ